MNLRHVHWSVGFEETYPELRREVDFGLWALFRGEMSGWNRCVLKRDGKKSGLYRDNWMEKRERLWLEKWLAVRELDQWEFGIMAVIVGVTGGICRSNV